jgi:hypothetical protein
MEKASPILKIASGGIYLTFAVFFIVMAVELYTGNVYLTPAITSYLPILMYLLPVAVLLSFVGWYFSRRAPSYPDIFMTVSSALLVAGYLIMWAFAGASFEGPALQLDILGAADDIADARGILHDGHRHSLPEARPARIPIRRGQQEGAQADWPGIRPIPGNPADIWRPRGEAL